MRLLRAVCLLVSLFVFAGCAGSSPASVKLAAHIAVDVAIERQCSNGAAPDKAGDCATLRKEVLPLIDALIDGHQPSVPEAVRLAARERLVTYLVERIGLQRPDAELLITSIEDEIGQSLAKAKP